MANPTQEQLDAQMKQEAQELKEAPVIQPIVGQALRCHICGQVFHAQQLKSFETVDSTRGPVERVACPNCHPNRGRL